MQLIFSDLWDLDKLQICAKGKSILEFRSVSKGIRKMQKLATEQRSTKNSLTEPPFGKYMFIWLVQLNFFRQIKIRCPKYKFAERSHNFLMQLLMQLIFGDL